MKKGHYSIIIFALIIGGVIGYVIHDNEINTSFCPACKASLIEQLSQEEKQQMYSAARKYIVQYSAEDLEVDLEVIKLLDQWVLLRMEPLNVETDVATCVLEKIEGEWVARQFGTALPEWQEKVPELFE